MSLEQWALAADMVASAAVVASLIYLAIQLRQSNALARSQTRQSMLVMGQNELEQFMDAPERWDLWTKDELSRHEKIQVHCFLLANLRQREYEWFERQEGTMDPRMYESYAGVIAFVLGTERTRRWWSVHGHTHTFDAGFVRFVDEVLEKSPLTDYFDSLDKW